VRWVESSQLPLPPNYHALSSMYETIMQGPGCSLAASTAAATANRKAVEKAVALGRDAASTDTKNALAYGELGFMGVAVILEQMRLACHGIAIGTPMRTLVLASFSR